jgi:Calcineurin-like phosphoesterase
MLSWVEATVGSVHGRHRVLSLLVGSFVLVVVAAACVGVRERGLTRSPYLTEAFSDRVTVNWATDRSDEEATLRWGRTPSCRGHKSHATRIGISVRGTSEWQWRVDLAHLAPDRRYCYRPFLGRTDLLGRDGSLEFRTAPAPRDARPFSFAVLGDWGRASSEQSSVLRQIGRSPARFIVTVGDNAYPSGDQNSYGDLRDGAVFGDQGLPLVGQRPVFAAQGNHGFSTSLSYLQNFPSDIVARVSSGRYRQDEYCCVGDMGSAHEDYASAWYAFNWGSTRFYVLESAWVDGPDDYRSDFEAQWNGPVRGCPVCGRQLEWLRNDLAAHAATRVKFAFFHYPLHVDTSAEHSDQFTTGSGALEGLLASNRVTAAFSGHAHVYERNLPQLGSLVTYVTGGGGGGELSPINSCSPFDAYALGADSSCRAPLPNNEFDVFHYLLVVVNGDAVTVIPINANGGAFDPQILSGVP